ncbi:MAG: TniQ family protein [Xanthomonadales bacterium]|nr:TniQ family protein [Xanthomonadales bacterium]
MIYSGITSTDISAHLLGNETYVDRLLQQHTMFGVFRHALSESSVARWSDGLKAGRHHSSLRALGVSSADLGALFASALRSCPSCIAGDKQLQGFATWKLAHQVSAIDRCPVHGAPLTPEIRPTGGTHERIWPLRLPGESCASCPTPSLLPPSDGYAAYLSLWKRILTDDLPWLRPAAWIRSMQSAVSRLGGIDSATDVLDKDVLGAWGVPINKISAELFLDGRDGAIREELSLQSRPRDLARRLLMHGCLDRLGLDLVGADEGDQRALPLSGTVGLRMPIAESSSTKRLLELADQFGLPLASIKLPELDAGFRCVAQTIGTHVSYFCKFAASLDEDLLQDLLDSPQFSAESWVGITMASRHRLRGAIGARAAEAAPA